MCFLFLRLSHVWRIHYKRKAVGCRMAPRHVCDAWCGQVCVIHEYSVAVWGWWPATGLTGTGAQQTRLNLGHINHTAISSHQPVCLFGQHNELRWLSRESRSVLSFSRGPDSCPLPLQQEISQHSTSFSVIEIKTWLCLVLQATL